MRLVFLGSGEFGLPTIKQLHEQHDLVVVVTQPDRPAGRKRQLKATPISAWAQEAGLLVIKTEEVNSTDVIGRIRDLRPDAAVVIAFGQKLLAELVDALGPLSVNLHASLLPKYRGAAPINWAIINGEAETGVSVISIAPKMDGGLVYKQVTTAIDPLETAGELHDRLSHLGPELITHVLESCRAGTLQGDQQDATNVSRARKLRKSDGHVDFTEGSDQIRCRIHGLTPWPGVRVIWRRKGDEGEQELLLRRVKSESQVASTEQPGTVLPNQLVATGQGAIRLLEVQMPGSRATSIEDFLRGHRLEAGDRLVGK